MTASARKVSRIRTDRIGLGEKHLRQYKMGSIGLAIGKRAACGKFGAFSK